MFGRCGSRKKSSWSIFERPSALIFFEALTNVFILVAIIILINYFIYKMRIVEIHNVARKGRAG